MKEYNEYQDKTILVTGGTGFIGSHTTVELQQAGYDVVIVDIIFVLEVAGLLHFQEERQNQCRQRHHDKSADKGDGKTSPTEVSPKDPAPAEKGDKSHNTFE